MASTDSSTDCSPMARTRCGQSGRGRRQVFSTQGISFLGCGPRDATLFDSLAPRMLGGTLIWPMIYSWEPGLLKMGLRIPMFLLCPSGLPPKGQRIGFEEPSLHNKLRNSEHLSVLLVAHGMSTNGVPRPPPTSVSFHRKCIKVHPKENITCSHTAIESRLASSKLLLAGALHAVRLARSASFLPSYIDHRPYEKNPSQPGNAVRAIYSGMVASQ